MSILFCEFHGIDGRAVFINPIHVVQVESRDLVCLDEGVQIVSALTTSVGATILLQEKPDDVVRRLTSTRE